MFPAPFVIKYVVIIITSDVLPSDERIFNINSKEEDILVLFSFPAPDLQPKRGDNASDDKHSLGTAAEYQPLPSSEKPATLAVRESDSIEPMGGLSPRVESRVSALRRRSSQARDRWATKMEFLLAVIGYAVDLGNIWRFPSVCYKHGGGIGYGICFICTFIACFYNAIISHAVYFVVSSIAVVGDHDASLIFIVYPQALATMSYSSAWSFIFFIMLITLGIDSTFAGIEALITGLCDESRLLARKREWFVGVVCVLYYFGSIPAISYGGQYVIPFLDEYGVSLSVLFIVTCEMVAVCWFYGIDRFSNDINSEYPLANYGAFQGNAWLLPRIILANMLDDVSHFHLSKPYSLYLSVKVIFVMTVWHASLAPLQLPGYTFPGWSVGLGWFLRLLSVLSVPLFAIYMLSFAKGTFTERLRWATTPQQRRTSASSLSADPTQIIDSSLLHPIHTLTQV
ncbi:Sodium:neurotransmitter symporter family protein [Necator americanus]|uniref:Sodium:neurotransmitter symporter family protein n=1 Tax=Necator americanus TaxID=51031 RepID=W2TWR1_NECAM|nr:Sodium:neurotransmitter symporter family protein [Necator americanus]ETN86119.1 Sodium:neurotransmitter symporter family protein [Necator americanus]